MPKREQFNYRMQPSSISACDLSPAVPNCPRQTVLEQSLASVVGRPSYTFRFTYRSAGVDCDTAEVLAVLPKPVVPPTPSYTYPELDWPFRQQGWE